jgi:hypothetical protein
MVSAKLGPTARAVLALGIEAAKRRKILALIAVYIDAGRPDPSITELTARSGFDRDCVVAVVERLEADGLLVVDRTGTGAPENRGAIYRVNVQTKEKKMSTHAPARPREFWREADFVLDLEAVEYPVCERPGPGGSAPVDLPAMIAEHRAAAEALVAAEAAGKAAAIRKATLDLVDVVERLVPALWEGWPAIEEARKVAGAAAVPADLPGIGAGTGESEDEGWDAAEARNAAQREEATRLRPTREAVERDMERLALLRSRVTPDNLVEDSPVPVAAAVMQARRLRRELEEPSIA